MDFALTSDQQALDEAFKQLAARYEAVPVGSHGTLARNEDLERELLESGFLNVAREEDFGPLEAVLLVEAMARSPYSVEIAASAIVAPQISAQELPRPLALARTPLNSPVRFLENTGVALIDTGADVRLVDLSRVKIAPVSSTYNYSFGRFLDFDPRTAPVLESVQPETLRKYWRLAIAAEIVGLMAPALEATTEHVKVRKQFGRPLGAFQVIQHRLAECLVLLEGARLLVREAALSGSGESAALAALYAQKAAAKLVHETHQFHGAIGLTLEHPLHYWTYRLRVLQGELGGPGSQALAAGAALWPKRREIRDRFHGQEIANKAENARDAAG